MFEEGSNSRRTGKKYGKSATSSTSSGTTFQTSAQLAVPVIASGAPRRMSNHRDDSSLGLPSSHKAAMIRRALAKLNILPFTSSRYDIRPVFAVSIFSQHIYSGAVA